MKLKIKTYCLHILLCLIIISCKGFKDFFVLSVGNYARADRASTFFQEEYSKIDSIKLDGIVICKEYNEPTHHKAKLFKTDGKIHFNVKNLDSSIILSLKKHFQDFKYDLDREPKWNNNCALYTRKNILNYRKSKENIKGHTVNVVYDIKSMTSKNLDTDDYAFTHYDHGNDRHLIEHKLIISIFKNDSLIYMDNSTCWTYEYNERDKELKYKVRQTVVDSLMNHSLRKYFDKIGN